MQRLAYTAVTGAFWADFGLTVRFLHDQGEVLPCKESAERVLFGLPFHYMILLENVSVALSAGDE